MAVTWKDDTGHTLSTVYQTLVTFSASAIAGGAKVLGVTLVNTGGTDRVCKVVIVPSGQVAADGYLIFRDTVPANTTMPCPGGPWPASASAIVQALQGVGTDVIARVHAFEET